MRDIKLPPKMKTIAKIAKTYFNNMIIRGDHITGTPKDVFSGITLYPTIPFQPEWDNVEFVNTTYAMLCFNHLKPKSTVITETDTEIIMNGVDSGVSYELKGIKRTTDDDPLYEKYENCWLLKDKLEYYAVPGDKLDLLKKHNVASLDFDNTRIIISGSSFSFDKSFQSLYYGRVPIDIPTCDEIVIFKVEYEVLTAYMISGILLYG